MYPGQYIPREDQSRQHDAVEGQHQKRFDDEVSNDGQHTQQEGVYHIVRYKTHQLYDEHEQEHESYT